MTTTQAPSPVRENAPRTGAPERGRAHPTDRLSWLWLLVGAATIPVSNLQTLVPIAAWVGPVFLLRFTRTQRARVALPVLVPVMCIGILLSLRDGFFPIVGGLGYVLFVAGLGLGATVPYAVDRLLAPRTRPWARTLVFPLAVTTAEIAGTIGNAFGTAGSVAYSQYANLPLLQLVSVTGIWGLTFLVSWPASVVNELWERGTGDRAARGAAVVLVGALLAALAFGGIRLAFQTPDATTVRVASLAPQRDLSDLAYDAPALRPGTPAERAAARDRHYAPVLDELFERSQQEARAGARIVAWSEAAALVLQEEQQDVVRRAAQLAARERIYLQISFILQPSDARDDDGPVNENHAVLLGPDGVVLWDYQKSHPTPGDGQGPGPGVVPVVDTPYGRLATVICQDDFFPALLRQAGRAGADILLVPSSDWASAAAWHGQQAPFRAVENGVALVRPTRQGVSLATDAQGRLVGHKADYFTADEQTLVSAVPTSGSRTLYPAVGDAVGYAAALGLLALIAGAVLDSLRSRIRSGRGRGPAPRPRPGTTPRASGTGSSRTP